MKYCIFLAIIVYLCLLEIVVGTSSLLLDQRVCTHDLDCRIIDLKSRCNKTSRKCECIGIFRLKENKCQIKDELKITNHKCNNTKQCTDKHLKSYCNTTSGFCSCKNGYLVSGLYCKTSSVIQITNHNCKSDENCVNFDENSFCNTNTNKCTCKKSYTDEWSKNCRKIKVNCNNHNQCNESNNEKCRFRHCNCEPGFTRMADGLCLLTTYCDRKLDCNRKDNFRCSHISNQCVCRFGFVLRGEKCKFIKRPCSKDFHCDTVTETCNRFKGACECRGIYHRSLSGECKLKLGYCSNKIDCGNTGATCDDSNRCKCNSSKDFEIGKSCEDNNNTLKIVISIVILTVFVNVAILIFVISKKRRSACKKFFFISN